MNTVPDEYKEYVHNRVQMLKEDIVIYQEVALDLEATLVLVKFNSDSEIKKLKDIAARAVTTQKRLLKTIKKLKADNESILIDVW